MRSHKPKLFTRQQTDPKIERRLDQELEQTFPASDAPQITRDRTPYREHSRRRSKAPAVEGNPSKSAR
jgi:hypothetical protein